MSETEVQKPNQTSHITEIFFNEIHTTFNN